MSEHLCQAQMEGLGSPLRFYQKVQQRANRRS